MGKVITETFCVCLSTGTGCVILGVLGIISNVIIGVLLFYAIQHENEDADISEGCQDCNRTKPQLMVTHEKNETEELKVSPKGDIPVGVYIAMDIAILNALSCCLLIYGTIKTQRKFLLPWFTITILSIIMVSVGVVFNILESRWLHMFIYMNILHLYVYSYVVVYSHFQILKELDRIGK